MPFTVDEHPVGALGSCGAYPSFGVTVHPRGPRRNFDGLHALASEDGVEDAGELCVAVPDQEAEQPMRSPRSRSRLRACWAVQEPSGWAVTPRMCTRRVLTSSRSTRSRISVLVLGRPGRLGYVHLRVISRRCQASSVPGVTSRWARAAPQQQPGQRRQDRPVGPVRPGPGDLTAQHSDLMTQHKDLRVLGRLAAAQQHQPAKDPDHDQVEQANRDKPRSCRNQPIRPNRRSQHPWRVLTRYGNGVPPG